jgi:HK97 family phage portal protein
MIHLKGICTDGYLGKSPISVHRENLLLSQNVLTYGQKFFTNGGNTEGVYTYPGELKEDAYQRLKRNINEQESLRNAHKSLLLEGGMKYERVNIPLEDAQFITTRKFQATEVARIFGVPPHLIADLERSTNNNIEHQGIEFVVYTLLPYLKKLEAELNYKLLTTDQAKKMYFSFNVNGLMRGDSTARANFYRTMYTISAMNPNEIRRLENMNEYEGGEIYFTQANMQPVEAIPETENE